MKTKKLWLSIIFLCIFPMLSECGEEEYKMIGNVSVPESMDVVKEADVNILVPKDGQLKKESSFLVKEEPDEYASRKFIEMEGYLNDIRKELEAQKKELKDLREVVEKIAQEKVEKR